MSETVFPRQVLDRLIQFDGRPEQFWQKLAELAKPLLGASQAAVLVRSAGQAQAEWRLLAQTLVAGSSRTVEQWLDLGLPTRLAQGVVIERRGGILRGYARLVTDEAHRDVILLTEGSAQSARDDTALMPILEALAWTPLVFAKERQLRALNRDSQRLAHSLELAGRLASAKTLEAAGLVLANELTERFACETVSVVWKRRFGLKLLAMSHAERVERRSELSALLEEAGQETLTRDAEIRWPDDADATLQAHRQYSELQQPGFMLSVPLIDREATEVEISHWGALILERRRFPFSQAEQWAIRLMADLALYPHIRLDGESKWFLTRIAREIGRSLPKVLKPQTHSGRRLVWGIVIAMLALLAVPIPYSVEGRAELKTDSMAFVGAPFDGYLAASDVVMGDRVQRLDPLFVMATEEIELERSALLADRAQSEREVELRRSLGELSQMQIAEAQVVETNAKLAQVDARLAAAIARAPIDGIIVEGEPSKNIGGAVRRGDQVVTIAALDSLYVEARVSERDLALLSVDGPARMTLLARPKDTFDMRIVRIIPAPQVAEGDNRFPVRLIVDSARPDWWVPGMTGVAKMDLGWKMLGWVVTRRLVDYLRLTFWI